MKNSYILPILLLLNVLSSALFGQTRDTLSKDPDQFLGQLDAFMSASKSEEATTVFRMFEQQLRSAVFTEAEFLTIRRICGRMLDRRLSANPSFKNYFQDLMEVKKVPGDANFFQDWHTVLDTLLSPYSGSKANDFSNFIDFSADLLLQQSIRYAPTGITWRLQNATWSIGLSGNEPVLKVEKGDLVAHRQTDSVLIRQTSGQYFPQQFLWIGKGGTVTWERLGLGPEVYAELLSYTIDTRKSIYTADEALLSYPLFLGNKKIRGTFSDRVPFDNAGPEGSYPRFESNQDVVDIREFGEGIQYRGGFRLEGTTILGVGSKDNKSVILIYNDRKVLVFKGLAERFTIKRGELITAERVDATFYSQGDSLYHPSVNIRYKVPGRELQLTRGERGSDRNPFYSSVHKVNIDADQIVAFTGADSVLIGKPTLTIIQKEPVSFESLNFFQQKEYEQFQGIAEVNPIAVLKMVAERSESRLINANDVAYALNSRFSAQNIASLLYDLASQGFVNYDSDRQMVEVKDKVFHYVNASRERVDYDALRIVSDTSGTNAVLNLKNKAVAIKGVRALQFSRKQRVTAKPANNQVVLKENRNMDFDSLVQAGLTEIRGNKFHFNYDKFQIVADSIKRFRIYVPEKRLSENPESPAYSLTSDIENFSGVLLIDAENNKSGKQDIPMFPSLNASSKSYVYYDGEFAKDTVYQRDSFYFELQPFNLNRLDDHLKEEIALKGKLISSRIFPDINETLRVRSDYSLGFLHQSPATGYPIYRGKGQYTGQVDLSNTGLLGQGGLKYLGATINSQDFIFKPKQVQGSAKEFALKEERGKQEVPEVSGADVRIDWRPYRDSMYVTSAAEAFALFKKGEHSLQGRLILTPGGLKGEGVLDWPQASISSPQFSFGAFSAKADTMSLKIKTQEDKAIAIQTENIKGSVDFDKQLATFRANQEFLRTSLPFNQYETSMNEFDWDMSKQTVVFKSDITKFGTFTSLHPDQDSLNFQGRTAFYDLKTYLLKVGDVPYVKSADAFIYPDSNRLEIQAGGTMTKFENATIVCDTINKNHKINRATVQVLGRKEYRASGFYEYNIGDKQQEIEFTDIQGTRVGKGAASQKATATRATGEVTEADSFLIDRKTSFYGTISLSSESVNLQFDGFARLEAEKLPQRYWFTVSSEGDKDNLAIRYKTPKSFDGYPLETGFYLSKEANMVYPRVMMPLYFRKDRPLLPVSGVFRYDRNKDQFIFGDSSKVLNNDYRGNKLVFQNATGKVEGEGKFNICAGLKYYSVDAAGLASTIFQDVPDSLLGQTPPPPVDFDLLAGLKFTIPEKLLNLIRNEIEASSFGTGPIAYLSDIEYYKKGLTMLFPDSKDFRESLNTLSTGVYALPKKDNPYTFLFSGLKLRWDQDYKALVTRNPDAGLISVLGEPVNKKLTCYIELQMPVKEDDDRVYIYLKLPNEIYYYFGYRNGILEINSNDNRFMDEAVKMKASELVTKMPDGESYEIKIEEAARATAFLRRAQAAGK